MGNNKRTKVKKSMIGIKFIESEFYSKSRFLKENKKSKLVNVTSSFSNPYSIHKVQNKLNKSNFKSELETMKLLNEFSKKNRIKNLKFYRNYPILNKYFIDFYCRNLKLAIEVDGSSHDSDQQKDYDIQRDKEISKLGIRIIRVKYPCFTGIDEVYNILINHKEIKQDKVVEIKSVSITVNQNPVLIQNPNVVGIKGDGTISKDYNKNKRMFEKIRQSYLDRGLDADKLLKGFDISSKKRKVFKY